jgi:hypothetical protein
MTSTSNADIDVLDDAYRRFVHLLLYARSGNGTWSSDDELTAFDVYLASPVIVCINDEPDGYHLPCVTRNCRAGEQLKPSDLTTTKVLRPKELRPPYVSATRSAKGWKVRYDFRQHDERVGLFLETGDEFMELANSALVAEHLRAFVENAFHAAESYAKAELLCYPVAAKEIKNSKKHTHIQSAYDLWARLENTDKRFPALLRTLYKAREAATYGNSLLTVDVTVASEWFNALRELQNSAHSAVSSGKRSIKVIATRAITAGTLVNVDDGALRPA